MKPPHRRQFLHLAAGAAALPSVSRIARAQDRPSRPVRIIVGFTAGSATDITARLFAQKLNEAWKTPVTVENIPGAGGSVGAERAAKSAPDGSTLYWGANGAMTINPSLQPSPRLRSSARSRADCSRSGDVEHPCCQQRGASEKRRGAVCAREGPARKAVICLSRRRHSPAHRRRATQEPRRRRHRPRSLSRRGPHRRD